METPQLFRRIGLLSVLSLMLVSLSVTTATATAFPPDEQQAAEPGDNRQSSSAASARTFKLALKSNLLFDLMGAPNIGIEYPIGDDFSVSASGAFAYWRINNSYALQTLQGGLDAKYWFNQRKGALTGWNAGLYGVYGGRYDVQWKQGWQGSSFFSAGLVAGYALPVGKCLNLEFALAAGWFHTPEARHYERLNGERLLWQQTRSNVNRFSLTKVQVNLVWLIGK